MDAFRHLGFGEFCGRRIAYRDKVELPHQSSRELVKKVAPCIGDAGMDMRGSLFLFGALRDGKRSFQGSKVSRVINAFAIAHDRKTFQTKVDADTDMQWTLRNVCHFNDDVQKPVASCIAREVGAVFDLPFWKRARVEYSECVASKTEGVAIAFKVAPLEGNPAKTFFAAPTQEWFTPLRARFGVLLADGIDCGGVKANEFAAASRKYIQVETGRPSLRPFQRLLLHIVAIVPNIVHRARLSIQQAVERFDAIAIDDHHTVYFNSSRDSQQIPKCNASAFYLSALNGGVSQEFS